MQLRFLRTTIKSYVAKSNQGAFQQQICSRTHIMYKTNKEYKETLLPVILFSKFMYWTIKIWFKWIFCGSIAYMAKAHRSIQKSENSESPSSFTCFQLLNRAGNSKQFTDILLDAHQIWGVWGSENLESNLLHYDMMYSHLITNILEKPAFSVWSNG